MALRNTIQETTASDEQIVERVKHGETYLFEIIMRRYNQRLFRVVRGILNNEVEAEEVMQEAYVRAYEHLDQFAGRSKFSTWLTKIAVYEAYARLKHGQRTSSFDNYMEELMATSDRSGLVRLVLGSTIQRLPPTLDQGPDSATAIDRRIRYCEFTARAASSSSP